MSNAGGQVVFGWYQLKTVFLSVGTILCDCPYTLKIVMIVFLKVYKKLSLSGKIAILE